MKENLSCPLCNAEAEVKYRKHVGYQSNLEYDICHCFKCNTAFANPLKADYTIYDHIYKRIDKVPGYNRYLHYSNQVLKEKSPLDFLAESEDMYWGVREYFKKRSDKNISMLEIGCGFGYLTYALNQAGYNAQGLDISKEAIEAAKERYGNYYIAADVKDYAASGKKFDLIILTEVIEHIEDVKEFFSSASSLLKEGGDLILTTPNKSPYLQDILWETEPPPVHLWWFSEKSVQTLGSQHGFTTNFIDYSDYNKKEFLEQGHYNAPYINIRDYQPTRLPRLNGDGEVIGGPDIIWWSPALPIQSKLKEGLKLFVKTFFKATFLLPLVKKLYNSFKPIIVMLKWRRTVAKISKVRNRPTMCAVMHKQALGINSTIFGEAKT